MDCCSQFYSANIEQVPGSPRCDAFNPPWNPRTPIPQSSRKLWRKKKNGWNRRRASASDWKCAMGPKVTPQPMKTLPSSGEVWLGGHVTCPKPHDRVNQHICNIVKQDFTSLTGRAVARKGRFFSPPQRSASTPIHVSPLNIKSFVWLHLDPGERVHWHTTTPTGSFSGLHQRKPPDSSLARSPPPPWIHPCFASLLDLHFFLRFSVRRVQPLETSGRSAAFIVRAPPFPKQCAQGRNNVAEAPPAGKLRTFWLTVIFCCAPSDTDTCLRGKQKGLDRVSR